MIKINARREADTRKIYKHPYPNFGASEQHYSCGTKERKTERRVENEEKKNYILTLCTYHMRRSSEKTVITKEKCR